MLLTDAYCKYKEHYLLIKLYKLHAFVFN